MCRELPQHIASFYLHMKGLCSVIPRHTPACKRPQHLWLVKCSRAAERERGRWREAGGHFLCHLLEEVIFRHAICTLSPLGRPPHCTALTQEYFKIASLQSELTEFAGLSVKILTKIYIF